jgi:hypothetical protein
MRVLVVDWSQRPTQVLPITKLASSGGGRGRGAARSRSHSVATEDDSLLSSPADDSVVSEISSVSTDGVSDQSPQYVPTVRPSVRAQPLPVRGAAAFTSSGPSRRPGAHVTAQLSSQRLRKGF